MYDWNEISPKHSQECTFTCIDPSGTFRRKNDKIVIELLLGVIFKEWNNEIDRVRYSRRAYF